MIKFEKCLVIIVASLASTFCNAQINTVQPKIMVIPFTKEEEDIRTVLDNDVNRRIAITKVQEGFDNRGYTTVDFIGKLKAAKDNHVFTSDNQMDVKSEILEFAGCDIYVVTGVDVQKDDGGASVNVVLSAYEVSTGNSLASKTGNSGKFYTVDFGKLTAKAIDKCIDDFVLTIQKKFAEIENNGRSVLVDISFAENSTIDMSTELGNNKLALSDILEEWIGKNAVKNNYHIQGTTKLKMIFDDVKIPLRDSNGNNYSSNKYALALFDYLRSLNLSASKQIKGNTIYITIN